MSRKKHGVHKRSKVALRGSIGARMRHSVRLGEKVRVHRVRAKIVHTRPKEMVWDDALQRMVPAFRDDSGELMAGQRWNLPNGAVAVSVDAAGSNAAQLLGGRLDMRDHDVVWEGDALNVKTTVGIDFTFLQTYGSAGLSSNGLNYVGLSNDSLTETSASTTLSNEITTNGLARAAGTYAHTAGASTATVTHVFTATATQACQKAALFSASSSGTMNHALSFTQRTLQNGDSITITDTITIT